MNLKKVFKNAGILAGGDVIAALLGLISFSILARSLGSEYFRLVQCYYYLCNIS